eukprot:gene12913-20840_t
MAWTNVCNGVKVPKRNWPTHRPGISFFAIGDGLDLTCPDFA